MKSPFLPGQPIGWPLLPVPDASGSLRWPTLDVSIRQTIRSILLTRQGEWLLARDRGVGLGEYLHEPNTAVTRRRLRDSILREITLLEKRVELDAVELLPSGERDEEITITIRYRIRRTRTPATITVAMKVGG